MSSPSQFYSFPIDSGKAKLSKYQMKAARNKWRYHNFCTASRRERSSHRGWACERARAVHPRVRAARGKVCQPASQRFWASGEIESRGGKPWAEICWAAAGGGARRTHTDPRIYARALTHTGELRNGQQQQQRRRRRCKFAEAAVCWINVVVALFAWQHNVGHVQWMWHIQSRLTTFYFTSVYMFTHCIITACTSISSGAAAALCHSPSRPLPATMLNLLWPLLSLSGDGGGVDTT